MRILERQSDECCVESLRPTICELFSLWKKEMVARTPPKQKKIDAPLNPILLREPVKKVATSCLFLGTFFLLFCLVAEKNCRTGNKKSSWFLNLSFLMFL